MCIYMCNDYYLPLSSSGNVRQILRRFAKTKNPSDSGAEHNSESWLVTLPPSLPRRLLPHVVSSDSRSDTRWL